MLQRNEFASWYDKSKVSVWKITHHLAKRVLTWAKFCQMTRFLKRVPDYIILYIQVAVHLAYGNQYKAKPLTVK